MSCISVKFTGGPAISADYTNAGGIKAEFSQVCMNDLPNPPTVLLYYGLALKYYDNVITYAGDDSF